MSSVAKRFVFVFEFSSFVFVSYFDISISYFFLSEAKSSPSIIARMCAFDAKIGVILTGLTGLS